MRTNRLNIIKPAVALALSIAATPILVNGQTQSLTSVNQGKSSAKPELKDPVKDTKAGVTELIETMLKSGIDSRIGSNLAPVIGLAEAMSMKKQDILTRQRGKDYERRACWVVYENMPNARPGDSNRRAMCAYLLNVKRSGLDNQVQYFRIDLNGKLEKAFLSKSKADKDGKAVRGSGVKFDQDIKSPEVRKTFNTELTFWLTDWLKAQRKAPASEPAPAAKH